MATNLAVLFHFSEEDSIEVFVPRPPLARPEVEPLVWAVDAWHAPHFYFPRDCPRVNFWARANSPLAAARRLLGSAERVSVIEAAWLERLCSAQLYRYEFTAAAFEAVDAAAGYYVSRQAQRPLRVTPMGELPRRLAEAGVELRVLDSGLVAFHLEVVRSGLQFSSSRLRNAADAFLLETFRQGA
jgi:hypothetical protein